MRQQLGPHGPVSGGGQSEASGSAWPDRTAGALSSLSSVWDSHSGQAGTVEARTSNSNSTSHSPQRYSKIGIVNCPGNLVEWGPDRSPPWPNPDRRWRNFGEAGPPDCPVDQLVRRRCDPAGGLWPAEPANRRHFGHRTIAVVRRGDLDQFQPDRLGRLQRRPLRLVATQRSQDKQEPQATTQAAM